MGKSFEENKWEKGQSGNPKGRPPKEYCFTDLIKEQGNLKDVTVQDGEKISRKDALITKLWAMAMGGDVAAMKYLMDRVDGKPLQQVAADIKTEGFQITIIEPPDGD